MKVSKSLEQFANDAGCFIERLIFDKINPGFCIVDADNNELMEIAPVHYSNGDRWKVINRVTKEMTYLKSLRAINKAGTIKRGYTGYKFMSLTAGNNGRMLSYGTIKN